MSPSIRRHRLALAAALLLGFTLALTCEAATPDKKPPQQKKLAINILVTAAPTQAVRPTQKPQSPAGFPSKPIKVAERGKPLAVRVLFKDCQPDAAGNCNVDADLHGETPSGARFGDTKGTALWRNRQAPHVGITQMGTAYMRITVEAKDPAGTYRVFAVAHDRNSGAEAKAEAAFEVK